MPINIHGIPNINQTHNNENKHVICSTDWTKKLNKLYFQWHKLSDQRGTTGGNNYKSELCSILLVGRK